MRYRSLPLAAAALADVRLDDVSGDERYDMTRLVSPLLRANGAALPGRGFDDVTFEPAGGLLVVHG